MKALVTGSTGFVGANLVEGLAAAGHEVRALRRSSSRMDALAGLNFAPVIGDVLNPASLTSAMKDIDWVFHAAGVADYWRQEGTAWLYRVNVGGTRNVLAAALDAGVHRVVLTSSAAALGVPPVGISSNNPSPRASFQGSNGDGKPTNRLLDESAVFNLSPFLWPYGYSKHLTEKVVHEYISHGLGVVIVNPTGILGPRDVNLNFGTVILVAHRVQAQVIPPGGANWIDVADVVNGHIAAAERGRVGERYILGAHNLSHEQFVRTVAQAIGAPRPRIHVPQGFIEPLALAIDLFNQLWPGAPMFDGNMVRLVKYHLFYDSSKARRELGLESPIPLEASLERTLRWYREHGYL
jgi:dihydroflavonol-4-reductase